MGEEDRALKNCFGAAKKDLTWVKVPKNDEGNLKGLTVVCDEPALSEHLRKRGLRVAGKAHKLADVIEGGYVEISDEFVETVLGGPEAKEWLLGQLKKDGKELKALPEAVPLDYTVFTALGQ